MKTNRVVVTGLGVVAPNGIGKERYWKSLLESSSGIKSISLFDAGDLDSQIAGEITEFNIKDYVNGEIKPKTTARHTQLGVAAALLALEDAGLDRDELKNSAGVPIPLVVGVSSSALEMLSAGIERVAKFGPGHAPPHIIRDSIPGAVTSTISRVLKFPTTCRTISNACPSGLEAIDVASDYIRRGKADIAIAGGTDAHISKLPFANFITAGLSSSDNEEPELASRPFDADGDTGVVSEGAGFITLENLEHALARGADIYLEILGYGEFMDPASHHAAVGMEQSIKQALANARKAPSDIHFICAHGPGNAILDQIETDAIKRVFGDAAYGIPICSIKGVVGNPMAAAGPLQVITGALSTLNSTIPPTTNCGRTHLDCDLDYVVNGPCSYKHSCILINSHGITGNNSSLVVEGYNRNP